MDNDFDRPQPRSQAELGNVAAETLGMKTGKIHAPKFHRMSISNAENGYSVDHTTEEPEDNDRNRNSSDPMAGQGPKHTTKTYVVTEGHPAYSHINSIHQHLHGHGTKDKGQGYQTTPTHPSGPQNR